MPVLVLSRTQIESVLDLDGLRHALRAGMEDVSAGRGSIPPRTGAMVADRGLLAAMPAYLPTGGLAAKLVSLFPGNAGVRCRLTRQSWSSSTQIPDSRWR